MIDKRTNLPEAIKLIKSGEMIALGGMNLYRRPIAAVREIIRAGLRNLTLLTFTGGFEADLLIGVGCVKAIRSCYVGLESFGLAPNFTKFATESLINVTEETESTITFGLRATLANVSFLPARALVGTDLLKVREDIQLVKCPYTGEEYPAIPAIKPDVAIIHAQFCDSNGNASLRGELAIDRELSLAAEKLIITTEKVVSDDTINKYGLDILGCSVDAVVEVPLGASPTSCFSFFLLDGLEIVKYVEMCKDNNFEKYIDNFLEQ